MKFKFAIPDDLLTGSQIRLLEQALSRALPEVISKNFPDWRQRFEDGNIHGGEIILQNTDMTQPITGLNPGIHLTMSLMSYKLGRDFDGLATDIKKLIEEVKDEQGRLFMTGIGVFIQMTLDRPVVKSGTSNIYTASGDGLSLLEY